MKTENRISDATGSPINFAEPLLLDATHVCQFKSAASVTVADLVPWLARFRPNPIRDLTVKCDTLSSTDRRFIGAYDFGQLQLDNIDDVRLNYAQPYEQIGSFFYFLVRILPRMSRASAITFHENSFDQDQMNTGHLAILIGTFLSNRQSANALQTLCCAYSARSYVRHVCDALMLIEGVRAYGDITTENEAHIDNAVGPAVVTALRKCGARVVKLELTGSKTRLTGSKTRNVAMVMTVRMARMPNTEFRIRFLYWIF